MTATACEEIDGELVKEFDFTGKFAADHADCVKVGKAVDGAVEEILVLETSTSEMGEGQQHAEGETSSSNRNSCYSAQTPTLLCATIPAATHLEPTQKVALGKIQHLEQLAPEEMTPQSGDANTYFSDDTPPDYDESPHPLSERWSPLGANYDDAVSPTSELLSPESELELLSSDSQEKQELLRSDPAELVRLRSMEEEQELLTSSLMALTSHFAHVQLRVRQIVEAPSHERDQLLKDLEEFAFRGIPEPIVPANMAAGNGTSSSLSKHEDDTVRQRQFELIDHLKSQLCELEKLAYESGAPVLPQHIVLEKQKIIIDELKNKLNLKVEEHELPQLSSEELKNQVESAFGEFVGPLRMKEQLVAQLKTQITDLERFIAYLQCDSDDSKLKALGGNEKFNQAYNSYAAKKKGEKVRKKPTGITRRATNSEDTVDSLQPNTSRNSAQLNGEESLNSKAHGLIDKASLLMQMFATTHFGTKAEQFQKNTLKKTSKGNHWGDLRAQLEVDIQEVASLAATLSFDREKLANMKRALKNSALSAATVNAHNGVITTIPPHGNRGRAKYAPGNSSELKTYTLSSDSDEDPYDCCDWEHSSRRMAHNPHYKGDSISTISKELTTAVRKNFAMTLLRLIQHGLRVETESATSSLIVPFMRCLNPSPVFAAEHGHRYRESAASSFVASSASTVYNANYVDDDYDDAGRSRFFGTGGSRPMHAWELILEYYYLKNGDDFNNTPARKLSQSFNLDIVDAQTVTAKQSFLSTVGMIISMHQPYKRSYNAHFKAFVCAGLNSHQLVEWLNLIFSCSDLVDTYYTPNSYVMRTGFRDSLRSIDALTKYEFDLPVDLAIRHFRNI